MPKETQTLIIRWLLASAVVSFVVWNGPMAALRPNLDFPSFYYGARAAWVEHRSPYTAEVRAEGQKQLSQEVFPYLYPPPSLLAFYPLAKLAYPDAKLALLGVNLGCAALLLYLAIVRFLGYGWRQIMSDLGAAAIVVYALGSVGISQTIDIGQINVVAALLIAVAWHFARTRGPSLAAAVPLSLAVLIKTYPILLLPLLIVSDRKRVVGWTVGLLAGYAAIAAVALPSAVWTDWYRNVAPNGGYGRTPTGLDTRLVWGNHSINGITSRLFSQGERGRPLVLAPKFGRAFAYGLSVTAIGVTIVAAVRRWRAPGRIPREGNSPTAVDDLFSAGILLTFLVAPLSWQHHIVMALPAVLIAIDRAFRGRESARTTLLILIAAFLTGSSLPWWGLALTHGPGIGMGMLFFAAVVVLWVYFVSRLWRIGPGPAGELTALID